MPTLELTDKELEDIIKFLEWGRDGTERVAKLKHQSLLQNAEYLDLVEAINKLKASRG